jgi:hypothetical protein
MVLGRETTIHWEHLTHNQRYIKKLLNGQISLQPSWVHRCTAKMKLWSPKLDHNIDMLTQLSSHNADSLLTHTHVPFCHSTWEKKCIFTLLLKFTTMHPLSKKIPCTLYFWSEYPFFKNASSMLRSCLLLPVTHDSQSFSPSPKFQTGWKNSPEGSTNYIHTTMQKFSAAKLTFLSIQKKFTKNAFFKKEPVANQSTPRTAVDLKISSHPCFSITLCTHPWCIKFGSSQIQLRL